LSPPPLFNNEQESPLNIRENPYHNTSSHKHLYSEVNNNHNSYAPTYENLVNGPGLSRSYERLNGQQVGQDNKFFSSMKYVFFFLLY
jgi:hypothetical protein